MASSKNQSRGSRNHSHSGSSTPSDVSSGNKSHGHGSRSGANGKRSINGSGNGSINGNAIPEKSKSSWSQFLRSIASFNGDLSSLTAPPFILSTTSLVEFSTYWCEHPWLFVAPASEPDPAKRALLVLRWFMSTLKQQYSSRSEKLGSEKKPLNPFLGEVFLGHWQDGAGTTHLVSEQVNHHPPVTAYSVWNDEHGVRLQGYNGQKASFSRTIHIKQLGHAILHIDRYDEDYLITLPSLHIEGLIYGSPFIELDKNSYIQSSSGYTARIDYSGKGWISGKKNTVNAVLYRGGKDKDKEIVYTLEGQWNDTVVVKDPARREVDVFRSRETPTSPLIVAPIEEQDTWESRRAWEEVANAIAVGDMDTTSREKSKIENAQREMRRQEQAEGRQWVQRFFTCVAVDPVFESLAPQVGEKDDSDRTGGIWRFDTTKAKDAKPPYHGEVTPY